MKALSANPFIQCLNVNLLVALAYAVVGQLSSMLVSPPGYSVAIWPAAGIAVVSCMLWKQYAPWVGVLFGSMLINFELIGSYQWDWLPLVIGLGSAIQAYVSARLMRYLDPAFTFDRLRIVVKVFLGLGVSSLVAPLVGNGALLLHGTIADTEFLSSLMHWWVGDWLGSAIFAPFILLFIDPRPIWRSRRLRTGLPLVVGFMFCVATYHYSIQNQRQQLRDKFDVQSHAMIGNIATFQESNLKQIISLASFFDNSEQVTEAEFIQFGQRRGLSFEGFRAWSWAPLVPLADKETFEAAHQAQVGQSFKIKSIKNIASGADDNEWLVPVTLIQPTAGNEGVLGLDLNSEPNRAAALTKARIAQMPVMTAKIQLAQDPLGPGGTLLIAPVFDRLGDVSGFCTAVIDLREVIGKVKPLEGMHWKLVDMTAGGSLVYASSDRLFPAFAGSSFEDKTGLYSRTELKLADRHWQMVVYQSYASLMGDSFNQSLLMLLLAFITSAVVGGITLISTGERHQIALKVTEKTMALSQEIARNQAVQVILAESEQRYRNLFDKAPVGHVLKRLEDKYFVAVNQAFSDITGYTLAELRALAPGELTPARYRAMEDEQLAQLRQTHRYGPFQKQYRRKDGQFVSVRLNGSLVTGVDGEELILFIVEDITEQERTIARVNLLAQAFQQSGEGIAIIDASEVIIDVNHAFTKITGYTREEAIGQNCRFLAALRENHTCNEQMRAALEETGFWQGEVWDQHKNGQASPKWLMISAVKDDSGAISHYIGSFTDISERKIIEERIHFLAHHDSLTQLPNRHSLLLRLEDVFAEAAAAKTPIAVMFIDMDNFKNINDTLGHHVGDLLLIEVARRLNGIVGGLDMVARLGGDEFVVVLVNPEHERIVLTAEVLRSSLTQTYVIENKPLHSSPSIGISVFPTDGDNVEDLMKNADMAMYRAKAAGRNNYQFFTPCMNSLANERQQIETALRQAITRKQLWLVYQPQVSISTGKIVGVEALLRWQHPELGMVPPDRFIPIAEENGMIIPIGQWVLETALAQLAQWRKMGATELRMAVNLSARQLRKENIVDDIVATLARHKLGKGALELEVTESVAMLYPEQNAELLSELRERGVELAIDDFGTGYSSLSYLKLLPLDRLKLDRSFIREIETDPNDAAISAASILMAHELGLTVVAEGVENQVQLGLLKDMGCDYVQGYYLSKPLVADECFEFIKQNSLLEKV